MRVVVRQRMGHAFCATSLLAMMLLATTCRGWSSVSSSSPKQRQENNNNYSQQRKAVEMGNGSSNSADILADAPGSSRRQALARGLTSIGGGALCDSLARPALAADPDAMYSPKFVQSYDDFVEKDGWSYRDVTTGQQGPTAAKGDRVVLDWSGYTIGYFGRPFQAKGGPQGGAFDKDLDYDRTVLGSGKWIPALEQAMTGMQAGGVRQVIVPYGSLSYPQETDPNHDVVGPKPSTFSGMRALNFVLDNPRLDRTLLFNVKVIRVDKPNGKGGFVRG